MEFETFVVIALTMILILLVYVAWTVREIEKGVGAVRVSQLKKRRERA